MKDLYEDTSVNKGWNDMRRLLDKEMPEKRKKRGAFWWWLPLALLPMALWGYRYFNANTAPSPTPTEQPSKTVAPPMPMAVQPNSPSRKGAPVRPEYAVPPPSKTYSSESSNNVIAKSGTETPSSSIYLNNEVHSNPKTEQPLNQNTPLAPSSSNISTTDISSIDQRPVDNKPIELAELACIPNKTNLLTSSSTVLEQKPISVVSDRSMPPIKPKHHRSRFQLGTMATLATEKFNSVNNFGGGLPIKWQPWKKWGLQSGLLYSKYIPTNGNSIASAINPERYTSALTEEIDYSVQDGAGNVVNSLNGGSIQIEETVVTPINSLQLVEIPMVLTFKPAKKWICYAGFNTAYLLKASISQKSYSGNYTLLTKNEKAIENLNSLVTQEFERWRFNYSFGIGFEIGSHLEVGLFSNIPIHNSNHLFKPEFDVTYAPSNNSGIGTTKKRTSSLAMRVAYFF